MCGRFTLRMPVKELASLFGVMDSMDMAPRYNIAPTQNVLAVRGKPLSNERELVELRWGLVPSWAADITIGSRAFNARCETAVEKPMFRSAMKTRRCVLLADGFYEWRREGKSKMPMLYEMSDGAPFALGGLWEVWNRESEALQTCTILTTSANELLATIHDRMPVIVPLDALPQWLKEAPLSKGQLAEMFAPYPAEAMRSTAVNPIVNSARNDVPACVEPLHVEG